MWGSFLTSIGSGGGVTLSNPGVRTDKLDEAKAKALVERWEMELKGSYLEVLDMHNRVYPPEAANVICAFLKDKVSKLKEANLKDIIASLPTDKGLAVLKTLSDTLQSAPLEVVDLSENALGIRGVEACRGLLSIKTLKAISLENDGLDTESMKVIREILVGGTATQLRKLRIYNNMIGVEGAQETGKILVDCASLREFRYEGCRPLAEGSRGIADGLLEMSGVNTGLERVFLEGSFGSSTEDDPLGPLCTALSRMSNLEHVRLYDCSLETSGAKSVLKALDPQTGLMALELGQNEIGPAVVKGIAGLVERNAKTLMTLNLASNELTSLGVEKLVKSLKTGSSLRELNLQENMIGNRGAKALIGVADALADLEKLVLDENGIDEDVIEELQTVFGDKVSVRDMEDYDMDEDLEEGDDDDEPGDVGDEDGDKDPAIDKLTKEFSEQVLTPDDVSI